MWSHIEVQNLAAPVLNDEEAVEQLERYRRYSEEIERDDHLAVILEKGQPALTRIGTAPHTSQVPTHSSFTDGQAEFLQFAMDFGGSPIRVLVRQAPDQSTNLLTNLGPTTLRPGTPTPVEAEAGAVPADDRLGSDDDEDVAPARPCATKRCPEQTVHGAEGGPGSLALEHGDLLAQGEDFERGVGSTAQEDADNGEDGEDEFRHKLTLVTCRHTVSQRRRRKAQIRDFTTIWSSGYVQVTAVPDAVQSHYPDATTRARID